MPGDKTQQCCTWTVVIAVTAVLIVVMSILIASFADVGYDEYGFKKRKSTGKVDLSKVYLPGRYFVGPDYTFKTFSKTAHFVKIDGAVFTKDKVELGVVFRFHYFLREEDLPDLHDTFNLEYAPVLRSAAEVTIKGITPEYSVWEFITERPKVEAAVFKAVKERLGGVCCEKNCADDCVPGCKPYHTCSKEDKGLFAQVKYFYMGHVDIPDRVETRHLKAHIETEQIAKVEFEQETALVEKNTQAIVRAIENEAHELTRNAEATATLIIDRARHNATAIVEQARSNGLKNLYSRLGITSEEEKNSFDYLRSLKGNAKARLTVDLGEIGLLFNGKP